MKTVYTRILPHTGDVFLRTHPQPEFMASWLKMYVCLKIWYSKIIKNPMVYQHVSPLKGAFGEYTICEFYPTSANNVCFGCIVSLASVDQFTRASASLLCWWGHTPCHWTWVWDSFCVQVLFYPNTSITNLQKLICFSFSGGVARCSNHQNQLKRSCFP